MQGEGVQAFAGESGVLVFAEGFLDGLHGGGEGGGVLAEDGRDRLPGVAGLLGRLAGRQADQRVVLPVPERESAAEMVSAASRSGGRHSRRRWASVVRAAFEETLRAALVR